MYMPTICTLAPKRGLNGQGRRQQSRIALGLSFLDRIDDSHGYGCTLHDFVDLLPPVLKSYFAAASLSVASMPQRIRIRPGNHPQPRIENGCGGVAGGW